jgi:nucleoside phosphorylase
MLLVVVASHREWLCCASAMGITLRRAGREGPASAAPGLALLRTGVGPEPARRASDHIRSLRPEVLLHVGYAGALQGGLQPGQLVLVTGVSSDVLDPEAAPAAESPPATASDPGLCDQLRSCLVPLGVDLAEGQLLTVGRFIDRSEDKARLAACGGYLACDMEAAVVMAAAREVGAAYVGLRAISDSRDHEMPPGLRSRGLSAALAWAMRPDHAARDTWHMLRGWKRAYTALQGALPIVLERLQAAATR